MSRNLFWLSDEEWGADRAAFADEFTRRGADRQRCSRQDGRSQTEGDFQGEQAVWLSQRIRAGDFTLRGLIAEPGGRGLKVDYRSVWEFVHAEKLGFKKSVVAGERERPDVARRRVEWAVECAELHVDRGASPNRLA